MEIIRDPAEPQPEPAEFEVLRNEFFEACRKIKTPATYWIIELRKVHTNGTFKDVFAIGKNGGSGGYHVETVFTKWWPSYVEQLTREDFTCESLNVYTNYSPCAECAPVLRKWLNDYEDVEMSIFYAFFYTAPRFGTDAQYTAGWQLLHEARNLVEVQDFDTLSLRELAERVNYPYTAIEHIYVAEHWLARRRAEVNDRDA